MAYLAVILERGLFLGKRHHHLRKGLPGVFLLDSPHRRLKSTSVLQERDVSRVNQISKLKDFPLVSYAANEATNCVVGCVCVCLPLRRSCCPVTL